MRLALFCHSLLSDWNHGSAHFLRGVASELARRGHVVRSFEPGDAWSAQNLVTERGRGALDQARRYYPTLAPTRYDRATLDLDEALAGVSLALVHEWTPPDLVRRIGEHRASHGSYLLFFHDTHHRAITDPETMAHYDLSQYDGVLAAGGVLRDVYLRRRWARRAFTWHEAADPWIFYPREGHKERDLVWIGNHGDGERASGFEEFLLGPARALGLSARAHGVRYPEAALAALAGAGVEYAGWIPNYRVPEAFALARVTVHVPRRPYAERLPGTPTIRPFEALACGIPLVSAPWTDSEELFSPGRDYLTARDGEEMKRHLRALLADPAMAAELAESGRRTVLARHTVAHRVDELLDLCRALGLEAVHP